MYLAIQYRFVVLSRQNKTFIPFSPADFFFQTVWEEPFLPSLADTWEDCFKTFCGNKQ